MSGDGVPAEAGSAAAGGHVREVRGEDGHWHLGAWERRWPRVRAGITGSEADFGLNGDEHAWGLSERYEALARSQGCSTVAVGRQVHGRRVRAVDGPGEDDPGGGLLVTGEFDAHVSASPGTLLAATAADCVPVFVLAPDRQAWALAHAGWRGVAAGVLEATLRALEEHYGVAPSGLHVHLGPAICGSCYEVGPEVVEALGPHAAVVRSGGPGGPRVDLRSTLVRRAAAAGVDPDSVSRSKWCTCCSGDHFRSYRCSHGAPGRMAAFVGWRRARDGVAAVPPDR